MLNNMKRVSYAYVFLLFNESHNTKSKKRMAKLMFDINALATEEYKGEENNVD